MSKEQVVQLVRERLVGYHPGGITLTVIDDRIRQGDGYWHVPVQPDVQSPRTFEYYDALADVETDLSLNEQLKIWLVPILPDEE